MKASRILIRQVLFVILGTVLRLPILAVLWLWGKFNFIKVIFLVYPADEEETRGFCPNIPWLRTFFSARPTLGGVIIDGFRPIGIYLVIPNTAQELAKRKNGKLCREIVDRLFHIYRLTGARSIGLAGQLGFIFENKHKIPMDPPLYTSLYGSVFSLSESVFSAIKIHKLSSESLKIGILGMGDIRNALQAYLGHKGFAVSLLDLRYTRRGELSLQDESGMISHLQELDLLINMAPTGRDFLNINCTRFISSDCIIIDFSHPGISVKLPNRIYTGNRARRKGLRFIFSLPGNWNHQDIPSCSLASILAIMTGSSWSSVEEFCALVKEQGHFRLQLQYP